MLQSIRNLWNVWGGYFTNTVAKMSFKGAKLTDDNGPNGSYGRILHTFDSTIWFLFESVCCFTRSSIISFTLNAFLCDFWAKNKNMILRRSPFQMGGILFNRTNSCMLDYYFFCQLQVNELDRINANPIENMTFPNNQPKTANVAFQGGLPM